MKAVGRSNVFWILSLLAAAAVQGVTPDSTDLSSLDLVQILSADGPSIAPASVSHLSHWTDLAYPADDGRPGGDEANLGGSSDELCTVLGYRRTECPRRLTAGWCSSFWLNHAPDTRPRVVAPVAARLAGPTALAISLCRLTC